MTGYNSEPPVRWEMPQILRWSSGTQRHALALHISDDYVIVETEAEAFAMTSLFQILLMVLGVVRFIILIHFIMSWLISFQVLNLRQPIVAQIWDGLNRLLEPIYGPIRRVLPNMNGLDLSPLVALLGVYALEIILRNNAALFM